MKTHKWMLFTYPVMDLKAAEAALNRAEEEGWTLDRVVWGCFARLVPAQAPEVWAVDWSDGTHLEREDYLALCADAGWTFVQKVRSFQLYKAPAGTTPIQTDSAVELSRFREEELRRLGKVVRSYAVLWLLLALVVGGFALLFSLRSAPGNLLLSLSTSNTLVYLLLCLPLLLAGLAAWTARLCLRLAQWRRAAEEEAPFPVPGPRSAGAAVLLCLLFRVWVFSLFPLLLLDFSQSGNIGTPLGVLVGVGIAAALRPYREAKAGRREIPSGPKAVVYAVFLLAVLFFAPVLSPLADAMMPPPPLEGETLAPVAQRNDLDLEGSFALRHEWWVEETATGERYEVHCYTARWPWLADWLLDRLHSQAPYVSRPGQEGVWQAELPMGDGSGTFWRILIHRGRVVLQADGGEAPFPEEDLARLLEILDQGQEV
ncbi:DUF2812 domain-containing protein [uncultured Intestinimonas sp.]|uniref:DUF2812 domain-containing protein n=1 Tax=uncultured Intestinimonas sp. TaxID=1689265 RepID=UPI0025EE0219|nr:DUF2812 domain-containing protein [uncultured Intestinimonas sp.]